uniref:Uncharacterized protein n=1 Tax=Setaria viridis TaxID=4556 RepID=A0A4U6USN2_SETVI|nr:hypothetical protein SEVIR_5G451333v2 [Setaria viridis]
MAAPDFGMASPTPQTRLRVPTASVNPGTR